MANTHLIDIGLNDASQDVIRKCNYNFRRLAADQSKQSISDIRQEADRTDGIVDRVYEIINALEGDIKRIEESVQGLIPGVGSVLIYADGTDPNRVYKNTVWEKIEGRLLLASDDGRPAGSKGGQGEVALTTENLPNHSHSMSHTHQYTDQHIASINGTALNVSQIPGHTHGSKTLTGEIVFAGNIVLNTSSAHPLTATHSGILSRAAAAGENSCYVSSSVSSSATNRYRKLTANATHEHTSVGGGQAHTHGFTDTSTTRTTQNSPASTGTTGAGEPVDIMPPYESVNVWKRIA